MEASRKDHHLHPLFVPVCVVCNFIELQGDRKTGIQRLTIKNVFLVCFHIKVRNTWLKELVPLGQRCVDSPHSHWATSATEDPKAARLTQNTENLVLCCPHLPVSTRNHDGALCSIKRNCIPIFRATAGKTT